MNTLIFLATVLAAGLPLGSLAQETCYTNTTAATEVSENRLYPNDLVLTVSSQEELNEAIAGCSTLIGDIELSLAYSGPFTLNGVVNVTGAIRMETEAVHDEYVPRQNLITSVEMLDVVYLDSLYIEDVTDVRVPNVERMGGFSLKSVAGGTVDLGNLRETLSVVLQGPMESVNLTSLRRASSAIIFCSDVNCAVDFESSDYTLTTPAIFPALEYAKRMEFNGTFSNFSAPNLRTIGSAGYPLEWPGFSYFARDPNSSPLDFAPLETLYGHLIVYGEVSSIDISPIKSTTAWIHLETTVRSKIHSSLEKAESIDIHGRIASVDVPDLTTVDDGFNMTSTYDIPCTASLRKLYKHIIDTSSDTPAWCNDPEDANFDEDEDEYTPSHHSSTNDPSNDGFDLSTGGFIGCVLGGVFVFGFVVGLIWRRLAKKRKTRRANANATGNNNGDEEENKDLPGIGDDGPPPPYSKDPPVLVSPAPVAPGR